MLKNINSNKLSRSRTSPFALRIAFLAFGCVLVCLTLSAGTARISLFPKPQPGQSFTYLLRNRTVKNVKTESRVATPSAPDDSQSDSQWLLHVQILDVHPQGDRAAIHARSQFQSLDSAAPVKNSATAQPLSPTTAPSIEAKSVEFTLLPDGRADPLIGLDALFPEQRQAWQEWLRQFAISAVFPRDGVKLGQSWKTTEAEQAPSPITRLEWDKAATYVRDEPCGPVPFPDTNSTAAPAPAPAPNSSAAEPCAVILTAATLKQKSNPKDTTPGDFKLHALHTSGSARGANETISYISLRTGLLMRVSEDAKQFMNVTIAKTDGSNQVRYNVEATSHTEILLLAPAS